MMKCVAETCNYFDKHRHCSDECKSIGVCRIITNADRIRAMTDEELVDLIIRYDSNLDCYFAPPNSQYHTDEESAKMDALKWLQQPTDEVK